VVAASLQEFARRFIETRFVAEFPRFAGGGAELPALHQPVLQSPLALVKFKSYGGSVETIDASSTPF
jgi:hypothetical protein